MANTLRGCWIADRAMRLVHVSNEWEHLFGLAARSVEGTTGIQTIHPDDALRAAMGAFPLLAGRPVKLQLRINLHGRFVPCTVAVQPKFDQHGRFDGCHGITYITPATIFRHAHPAQDGTHPHPDRNHDGRRPLLRLVAKNSPPGPQPPR